MGWLTGWKLKLALAGLFVVIVVAAYLGIEARGARRGRSQVQERLNERVQEMRDRARRARHDDDPGRREQLRRRFYRD